MTKAADADLYFHGDDGRPLTAAELTETRRRLAPDRNVLARAWQNLTAALNPLLETVIVSKGSLGLFDRVDLTAPSEYSSRQGEAISVLQIHHSTCTNYAVARALMDPGGRTVSSNGLCANDGTLYEVVPLANRPFTSATGFDRRSLTVECNNTTLGPQWGISAATRTRLATLAVDMFEKGLLTAITRSYVIGHYEVPGTYATACPGPDMHLDAIVAEAQAIHAARNKPQPPPIDAARERRKKDVMYIKGTTDTKTVYAVFTDANGNPRLRVCNTAEASFAELGGLVVQGDDKSVNLIGSQSGYVYGQPIPFPTVQLEAPPAPPAPTPA